MARDEDYGQLTIGCRECLLQFEAVKSRHSDIKENAAGSVEAAVGKEVFRRTEIFSLVAGSG